MFIKKMGVVTLSSAIALSGIIPASNVLAASAVKTEQVAQEVKAGGSVVNVEKEKLIERARSLFPEKFEGFTDQEFHANFNTYPLGEGTERYGLHFFKEVKNGEHISGNVEFAGKDLTLVSYHFSPVDTTDALYPPKVTKKQAEMIANDFLKKMNLNQYRLTENDLLYYSSMNRPLTEPVEYSFTFEKLENGIPVQDQNVTITVLGNGEVTQFYQNRFVDKTTYDSGKPLLTKEEALKKVKDQLAVQLRYMVDHNYQTDQTNVELMYVPVPTISGVDAKTGKLKVGDAFVSEKPKESNTTLLAEKSSPKVSSPLTKEQAKKMAEDILKPKEDNVKLVIEGINEIEREGIKMYSVQYMYQTGSSGSGSSFEINKETGEILNFHNIARDRYYELQAEKDIKPNLSEEDALKKAVEYINQYAYSNLDEYAYPTELAANHYQKHSNEYYFHFPRVINGIIVNGNGISVSVSGEDGELFSLNVNSTNVEKWPDVNRAVDMKKALAAIKEKIDVKLQYVNHDNNQKLYQLFYSITTNKNHSYFDAISGTWKKYSYVGEQPNVDEISHPWAAEELNFMISANIIQVDDPSSFNPDRAVTKGEALNIIYKSLARFYNYPEPIDAQRQTTFKNIKEDHPLYEIIERSAQQDIIDTTANTFNVDEKLTREELAFWFARAMGLQLIAEHPEIYKLDFVDAEEMNGKYRGHIAITNALGILAKDVNNEFNPKSEVTLAELAVSNVRLAKIASEMNIQLR
ncbi:YcdB/YcdC domain-containing protein [Bacillus sp. Marseille-P3661]|uniref:YcdB/YcdC domain-containing protein n=1 Tax=Bacillus sp. Marseille-P3661 TaxID=1936234 RepID=UPI0015E18D54|nr:YcdB/YcdC domain-containing protein [Bacillus sp. Marseille-P3661]